jgi:hypothetical protein
MEPTVSPFSSMVILRYCVRQDEELSRRSHHGQCKVCSCEGARTRRHCTTPRCPPPSQVQCCSSPRRPQVSLFSLDRHPRRRTECSPLYTRRKFHRPGGSISRASSVSRLSPCPSPLPRFPASRLGGHRFVVEPHDNVPKAEECPHHHGRPCG